MKIFMLGISTSYFSTRGYSIYESVKKAHEMGFSLVELGANHDYEENVWQTVRKIAKDFPEVTFTQHCYFPPISKIPLFLNPAEGLSVNNKKILSALFKGAKILGSKVISFHPGVNSKFSFNGVFEEFKGFKQFKSVEKIPDKESQKSILTFFSYLLSLAKIYQVKVAVENIYTSSGEKPTLRTFGEFKDLFLRFPKLYFLFDYGHATLLTKNPNQFFKFKERIIEMHLHDVKDNLDHRILGTGKVNLESLFFEIKKLKIKPYLVLEHSGEPSVEEIIKEKKLVEKYLEIN